MRAFVFTDRALEGQAGRFVWLSINTEKKSNAAFLERYPIDAFPTLLVIDPRRDEAVVRWVGGADVPRLNDLLDDGERAMRGEVRGADAILVKADRSMGRGHQVAAVRAYRKSLARAPEGWTARDRAVESLLTALTLSGAFDDCVATARAYLPTERDSHYANVAALGLGCAAVLEAPADPPAVAELVSAGLSVVEDPGIELPADDRSGLFGALVDLRKAAADEAGAHELAEAWLSFLDGEAGKAGSPRARSVFDSHRLTAALAAGEPERAVPVLLLSEKDFPEDYNPPARLAVAYLAAGQAEQALSAVNRAMERVYGPRALRVFALRAEILETLGDLEGAKATLRDALSYATNLPRAQVSPARIAGIERRLAEMD